MQIINQYSMLWAGLILLGVVAVIILRRGFKQKSIFGLLIASGVLVIGWLALRPDAASTTELAQFQAELGQGQSVLLELQSPY